MKTVIAGGRELVQYRFVEEAIAKCPWKITEVVSGAARGIDKLGEQWAKNNDVPVKQFHADWHQYGKAAGPIRNRRMAEYAEALLAIWDGKSKGTRNMIEQAVEAGRKVAVYFPASPSMIYESASVGQ